MKLFKMKTRQMVDKSFSQYLVYQAFQAISHDIFNDKTWFPTSRCSCEDVFYEVFCIVDAWNRWRRTGMWLNSWQPKSVIMARMVSSFHLRSMN